MSSQDIEKLNCLHKQVQTHEERLIIQDQKITMLIHDMAELTTNVIQLNRHLNEIHATLENASDSA